MTIDNDSGLDAMIAPRGRMNKEKIAIRESHLNMDQHGFMQESSKGNHQ